MIELILVMFVILGGNVTNSTISDCNYYGDDDDGLQDLLDRGWDCESDSIFES